MQCPTIASTRWRTELAKGLSMGRIIARTKVTNLFDESRFVECGMLVHTGAAALIVPSAWKERLGEFPRKQAMELVLDNGHVVQGEICAPVEIEIAGFRPVVNEVMFAETLDDAEEPLLGYVILEQAQATVDRVEHRLVPVRMQRRSTSNGPIGGFRPTATNVEDAATSTDGPADLAAICRRAGIKGGYPQDPTLRGLAAVTHHSPLDDIHPCMTDPDVDPPPQSSWRRWQAAHRKPDPNAPALPSFLKDDG